MRLHRSINSKIINFASSFQADAFEILLKEELKKSKIFWESPG